MKNVDSQKFEDGRIINIGSENMKMMLGSIQIRHTINHPNLIEDGGHIGYGIGKSFRRRGHASQMLALALDECKKLRLEKVLITCDSDNIGSAKTIENNGGLFERTTNADKRRYWVTL